MVILIFILMYPLLHEVFYYEKRQMSDCRVVYVPLSWFGRTLKKDVNENNVDMTVFREVKYIFY